MHPPRALPFPQRLYFFQDGCFCSCALFCPFLSVLQEPVLWSSRFYLYSRHFSSPCRTFSSWEWCYIFVGSVAAVPPLSSCFLSGLGPGVVLQLWMLIPYLHVSWNLSQSLSSSHVVGMGYGWFYLLPFWIYVVLEKVSRDLNLGSHHHQMGTERATDTTFFFSHLSWIIL